jgi:hypothetical protein
MEMMMETKMKMDVRTLSCSFIRAVRDRGREGGGDVGREGGRGQGGASLVLTKI